MNLRLLLVALSALGTTAAVGGCAAGSTSAAGGDASCAAVVEVDGHRYVGYDRLLRTPETTGLSLDGVVPGCDDGNGAVPPSDVEVAELAAIPPERAVLFNGMLYVREGGQVPRAARAWFEEPGCDREGSFELSGAWLDVDTSRRPRFDDDLQPPYQLTVRVDHGPEMYDGSTVTIHATRATDPSLDAEDVKQSLWRGGDVTGTVHCEDGSFVADALVT